MVISAVAVLAVIAAMMAMTQFERQKVKAVEIFVEKGATLIRSIEAGLRDAADEKARVFNIQKLLMATAQQPDIDYLIVTDAQGSIVADSDPSMLGQRYGLDLNIAQIAQSKEIRWRQSVNPEGAGTFEVYRGLFPLYLESQPKSADEKNKLVVYVGFNMDKIEKAAALDKRDTIIMAISQAPAWNTADGVLEAGSWLRPADDGRLQDRLFAGGDDLGPGIASRAVGQGRHAAESAHAELRGLPPPLQRKTPPLRQGSVKLDYYADGQRSPATRRPESDWLADPDAEIDLTLSCEQASEEAARCMSCGLCFDCQQCFMYCNRSGFTRVAEVRPGKYYAFAFDACEGCGKCIELCPCGYLEAREALT
jgi:Pyruvate/2-oxoacid:ferredoxin oxidoreductase delta subunit